MKLEIKGPPGGFTKPVTLKLEGGNAAFWTTPTKDPGTKVTLTNGQVTFPCDQVPEVLWVEATSASSTVRDIVITAESDGEMDKVKATGIWATKTGFKNDPADAFWDEEEADDPEFRKTFDTFMSDGFGIQYSDFVYGGMGMEFTIQPTATAEDWERWGVHFDVTRQKEYRTWVNDGTGFRGVRGEYWPGRSQFTDDGPTGTDVDKANDETTTSNDNDNTPIGNKVYSIDAPGHSNTGAAEQRVDRFNFIEFVRIGVDGKIPAGNTTSGSRASPKAPWHVQLWSDKSVCEKHRSRRAARVSKRFLSDHSLTVAARIGASHTRSKDGNAYKPHPGHQNVVAEEYKNILPAPAPLIGDVPIGVVP